MSSGGIPGIDKLLEEMPDEENEAASESDSEEAEGREYAGEGEDDREGGIDPERDDFEEEAESGRTDVGGSRRSTRIRNLNRRLQESNRRNEELERRMNALEQGRNQPAQPTYQESQEQEQARMALMTPEERMQYTLDRGMHRVNSMVQQAEVTRIDQADKDRFRDLAASDRLARRFSSQVEELFQTLKNQGRMTAREVILDYLIGQAARKANANGSGRQKRRQAEQTISRNRVNTGAGRSDVSSERRRTGQSLEQRLEGKLI